MIICQLYICVTSEQAIINLLLDSYRRNDTVIVVHKKQLCVNTAILNLKENKEEKYGTHKIHKHKQN